MDNMGKINGERYPERLTAEEAVEVADVIVKELDGSPPSKEVLADALGHSTASSGAYITKIADVRNYGILPSRGLDATSLARRVANPMDREERREAIFEMYENVPILAKLYDHLSGRDAPNQLWSVLVEVADVERNEAKEVEDDIRKLYEDMLRFAPDESEDSGTETPSKQDLVDQEPTTVEVPTQSPEPDSAIFLSVGNDEHRFEDLTVMNIEIAQRILEVKKQELASNHEKSGEGGGEHDSSDVSGLDSFST